MADTRMPVAGEPAQIDGEAYVVLFVNEDKEKVKFGCAAAAARAERTASVRAEFQPKMDALEAKYAEAVARAEAEAAEAGIDPKNLVRAAIARPSAEMDLLTIDYQAALDAIPRGVSVGVALKDVYWLEEAAMWAIPGRFHAYNTEIRRRPSDPAELTIAAGR